MLVAQKVAAGVYKGVTTTELDELAAETSAALTSTHPDYAIVSAPLLAWVPSTALQVSHTGAVLCLQLAARIAVSNLHKSTLKSFSQT